MQVGGHDFSQQTMTVVCKCVAEGRPVRIYQNAPDGMSMVCGSEHEVEELQQMCHEHLVDRPELADLPRVDCGFGGGGVGSHGRGVECAPEKWPWGRRRSWWRPQEKCEVCCVCAYKPLAFRYFASLQFGTIVVKPEYSK